MQAEMDKLQGHRRTALVLHAKVQQLTRQLAERQAATPPKPRKNGGGGSPAEKRRAGSASPTAKRTAVPLAARALFQPMPPLQSSSPPAALTTPSELARPDADVLYIASDDEAVPPTAAAAAAAAAVSGPAAASQQLQCTGTFRHAQLFDALQWH